MSAEPSLSEPRYIPYAYTGNNQKWLKKVKHFADHDYSVEELSADPKQAFTYRQYERTNDADIKYRLPGYYLDKGRVAASLFIGAEVTVSEDWTAAFSTSPWNFTSSEQMQNWDVILCVDETKFFAHKAMLSSKSPTFSAMFEGEFREKNQQEVSLVPVEGTDARHFEAFLQSLYPDGSEPKDEDIVPLIMLANFYNVEPLLGKCIDVLKVLPTVSNVDKLLVAIKINSTSLEDAAIASLTKADIDEIIDAEFEGIADNRRVWQRIFAQLRSMLP